MQNEFGKVMNVRITLKDELLGTSPSNEQVYRDYIGSKAPDAAKIEDEVAALGADDVAAKGMTVFPKLEDGTPILWAYQVKGFMKDACGMLSRLGGKDPETGKKLKAANESGKLTMYKKTIDGLIFVEPDAIPIRFDGEIGACERPLRAQTMQGERVALACSEQVPAGAVMEFQVICMDDKHQAAVREWLNYGAMRGIGQWRNSGKGRFLYDELDDDGNVIGGNNEIRKRKKS